MTRKKINILALITLCFCLLFGLTASADNDKKPTSIKASGKTVRTVTVGSEFKLKVKINGDDDYLKWSITGKKGIVAFEDDDRSDDDIEFHALKKGTARVTCQIKGTSKKVTFTVKVKVPSYSAATQKITRVGSSNVSVPLWEDKELKVRKASQVKDRYLKWTIEDTRIVRFDDDDIYDNDIEIEGRRKGTTTVTCTHLLTGKSISYKVTVTDPVPDYVDDDDD